MSVLTNIEPQSVFNFFEDICSIPHGSGNTKQISDYLADFAKNKGLEYYQDKMNNVIIIKEASFGYEKSDPIILQSHIDMVCEKDLHIKKDMSLESIDLKHEGDLVSAIGTTLGADNGIGVALTLAVLNDNTLSHPRIEAVFTVDEEIGMLGAFGIDVSPLKGKKLLNLDSGNEKIFTVSCAGGITSKSSFSVKREEYKGTALKITISGLSGGHSGVKIIDGGANSNFLMGRLLAGLSNEYNLRLAHIEGGFKDNAICVETSAVVVCTEADKCINKISAIEKIFKNEYSVTDPDLKVVVSQCDYLCPFNEPTSKKIILFLNTVPNGVQTMSSQIDNLVQTSLNFAITNTTADSFEAVISIRSSVESQKAMLADKLYYLTQYLGGNVETWGDYPGWEFKTDSDFRNLMSKVFCEQFGNEPNIEAIHAGLECGLFSGRIPGLDCISYGPDMWDVHTPRERLSVSSTQRVWNLLVELLKRMK